MIVTTYVLKKDLCPKCTGNYKSKWKRPPKRKMNKSWTYISEKQILKCPPSKKGLKGKLKPQCIILLTRKAKTNKQKYYMLGRCGITRILKVGGEGEDRAWDGWMASPTQWTSVWVSSRSRWWREAWCAAVHGVTELDITEWLNWEGVE